MKPRVRGRHEERGAAQPNLFDEGNTSGALPSEWEHKGEL